MKPRMRPDYAWDMLSADFGSQSDPCLPTVNLLDFRARTVRRFPRLTV